jgi:cell division protein ZapA (FtsZ GTPase activity inhibitor)
VSESPRKHVVTVEIAGEEFTLRALATPEYTQECARVVDEAIQQILQYGTLVQSQKAVILAAMSLADQLLRTRGELEALRGDSARTARRLSEELEARLRESSDLATSG